MQALFFPGFHANAFGDTVKIYVDAKTGILCVFHVWKFSCGVIKPHGC